MFRKLRLHALALSLAAATLVPTIGLARDHDRDDYRREFKHERHEQRERARRFLRNDYWYGPGYTMAPGFGGGYYDQWGFWHPVRHGYYDRWGYWHP